MSNLNNFLKHRSVCPFCSSQLNFVFQSKNKDGMRFENNNLKISILINKWKLSSKSSSLTVELNINCDTNEFYVNFLDKNGEMFDKLVSCVAIKNYKGYIGRNANVRLYKTCLVCKRYTYSSTDLTFDYRTGTIDPFYIGSEHMIILKEEDNDVCKIYTIFNSIRYNDMLVYYGKIFKKNIPFLTIEAAVNNFTLVDGIDEQFNPYPIEIPSFEYDLSSIPELIDKLDLLMLFS